MIEDLDISDLVIHDRPRAERGFAEMRARAPIHFCPASPYGPYWSVTRLQDIVEVERDHETFSSEGNVIIGDVPAEFDDTQAFATADPPVHTRERQATLSGTGPGRAQELMAYTRELVQDLLDDAPRDSVFDWSSQISAEITSHMAAKLFGFSADERQQLAQWYQILVTTPSPDAAVRTWAERDVHLANYRDRLLALWAERAAAGDGVFCDVLAGLVHNPNTSHLVEHPMRLLGTVSLIAGANEAARTGLDACVVAFNQFPDAWQELERNPKLLPRAVAEIVRWQSPILHMRRTATRDVTLHGQQIRAGDKVVLWYCSGNRDERWFDDAGSLQIDRDNVDRHVGFGAGIHRCLGRHIARMEMQVVLELLLERGLPQLSETPPAIAANFSSAYQRVMVKLWQT